MTFFPSRLFTVEEANALLPHLTLLFGAIRPEVGKARRLAQQLEELGFEVPEQGPLQVNREAPAPVQSLQDELKSSFDHMAAVLQQITELGVEVKSAEGLIDFRSRRNGAVVYLCWRYGEDEVTYWHDLGTGFSSRAPIADPQRFTGELRQ